MAFLVVAAVLLRPTGATTTALQTWRTQAGPVLAALQADLLPTAGGSGRPTTDDRSLLATDLRAARQIPPPPGRTARDEWNVVLIQVGQALSTTDTARTATAIRTAGEALLALSVSR